MLWGLMAPESLGKAGQAASWSQAVPCHHGVTSTSDCGNAELRYGVIIRRGNSATRGCSSLLLPEDPTTLPAPRGWSCETSKQTGNALSLGFFPKAVRSDRHPAEAGSSSIEPWRWARTRSRRPYP